MILELPGRVVIVTGAARGIGLRSPSACRELARVVIANVAEEGAAAAERLREGGGEAMGVAADVTSPDEVGPMVERVLDAFGQLDILVNNAGITGHDAPLWEGA